MNMTIARDTTRSFLLLAAVTVGVGFGSDALGATVSALSSDGTSARSTVSHLQMAKNDKKAEKQKNAKEEKARKNDKDDDDDDDKGMSRNGNGKDGKGREQREEAWEKGKGEGQAWGKGHGKGKPDKE